MKLNRHAFIVLLFVFLQVSEIYANGLDVSWHAGQLTLADNAVLTGDLSYNWSAELVLLRQSNGRIRALSAGQVKQFNWFDFDQHKHRKFVALPCPVSPNQAHQRFFEVFMEGPLVVVRRLEQTTGLFKKAFRRPTNFADDKTFSQDHNNFAYYVYDEGQFLDMDRFHSDIYKPILAAYERPLRQYVRDRNLNDRTTIGRLILIDRYNTLAQQDQQRTASAKEVQQVAE